MGRNLFNQQVYFSSIKYGRKSFKKIGSCFFSAYFSIEREELIDLYSFFFSVLKQQIISFFFCGDLRCLKV